jgi:hypothetical protein
MTVQTTAPVPVDELLDDARRMARQEGGVPSKDRLMKTFRIGRPKASDIHDRLLAERPERRVEARKTMRRVASRKGPARPLPVRFAPLLAAPLSPGMGPVADMTFPQPSRVTEGGPAPAAAPLPVTSQPIAAKPRKSVRAWPVLLLALPAFVAIWAGWVDLGRLTGFGVVHPLPGILDDVALNTAITLPIGLETYAAYALKVWVSGAVPAAARRFAKWSAIGSLVLGAAGQVAYHLMVAAGMTSAPWQITTVVACLPVAVLGMGAGLYHLAHREDDNEKGN